MRQIGCACFAECKCFRGGNPAKAVTWSTPIGTETRSSSTRQPQKGLYPIQIRWFGDGRVAGMKNGGAAEMEDGGAAQ
jgi:hypothetical protein